MIDNVITFPEPAGLFPKRRTIPARIGPNMQRLLFRSRDLILESDEADLVRDVCLDLDRAEKKLKAMRRRLQSVQEQAAAQVQLLTAADTKLSAAIVAALLSTRGGNANA
jgi:Mg2+ and Co2+ transporter CorA